MEHFFWYLTLVLILLSCNRGLIDDWALGLLYECYFILKIEFNFYGIIWGEGLAGRGVGGERGCRNII